jgi:hypothetical protein
MSKFCDENHHAQDTADHVDSVAFFLGLHCRIFELHRDHRAAQPLSSEHLAPGGAYPFGEPKKSETRPLALLRPEVRSSGEAPILI